MVRPAGEGAPCPDDHCPMTMTGPVRIDAAAGLDAAPEGPAPDALADQQLEDGALDAVDPDADADADDGGPVLESLRRGLLLWLRFDDPPGTAFPRDDAAASSRSRAVALDVGKTWVPGRAGGAFDFGAGGKMGYLEVPSSASLNRAGAQMSLAAWLWRPAARPGTIVSRRTTGVPTMIYRLAVDAGERLHFVANDRPGYRLEVGSLISLPTERWVHVAVTLGGGEARLYVDGIPAGGRDYNLPLVADLSPLLIGASQSVGGGPRTADFYLGRIDELVLYDRALSAGEIGRLAGGELP
jgi:hypothetical protein